MKFRNPRMTCAVAALVLLSACTKKEDPPRVFGEPGAPAQQQQQQQQAQQGSSWMPAIMGGALGYMLGRNNTPAAAPAQPQVIERRVYVPRPESPVAPQVAPTPAPRAATPPAAPLRPSTPPPPPPPPKPTAAPKPSYAPANSYKPSAPPRVTYSNSFKK